MTKNELRQQYKDKRKTLSDDEVLMFSDSIFKLFIDRFRPKEGQKIHLFISIEKFKEIDTSFFIQYCFENKIEVYTPKIHEGHLLSILIDSQTIYEKNSWGVKEPISNACSGEMNYDYVITPLLYADEKGNRVGYGKGFYDGFFSQLPSDVLKVGVNYFEPNETIDDVWEQDVPLDYLITPNRILSFNGSGK